MAVVLGDDLLLPLGPPWLYFFKVGLDVDLVQARDVDVVKRQVLVEAPDDNTVLFDGARRVPMFLHPAPETDKVTTQQRSSRTRHVSTSVESCCHQKGGCQPAYGE